MTGENLKRLYPGFDIPDDSKEALSVIEDNFLGDLEFLEANTPARDAPLGVRTAHRIEK